MVLLSFRWHPPHKIAHPVVPSRSNRNKCAKGDSVQCFKARDAAWGSARGCKFGWQQSAFNQMERLVPDRRSSTLCLDGAGHQLLHKKANMQTWPLRIIDVLCVPLSFQSVSTCRGLPPACLWMKRAAGSPQPLNHTCSQE